MVANREKKGSRCNTAALSIQAILFYACGFGVNRMKFAE
jgi:hypothetical protein